MFDMMKMMKQLGDMQSKMQAAQDAIVAATADAQTKAAEVAKEKMAVVTAGLPIPPGMLNGMKM
jgi:DNA-binding protein YbaB